MGSDKERLPGRLARTLKVGLLGTKVGSSYLGGKIADAFRSDDDRASALVGRHVDNAKRIAETMGQLRGPLMKVGQLMSTHAEALPEEMTRLLQPLQTSAPPMAFETMREVLTEDLGAPPEALFAELDPVAVAAASLGQVHRGRLPDGTQVAVKVQYPGAVQSVEGDLSNIHAATKLTKRLLADALGQTRFDVTPFAEELAEHLLQETDYCREAYNAKLLGRLLADDEELVVPRVHDSHSGLRTITYDWIEGEPLTWALDHPDHDVRERVVRQLQRAFWKQFFEGGLLHADPHPGNYLFQPDGTVGLLDFGCVKRFDEFFLGRYAEVALAALDDDKPRTLAACRRLGVWEGDTPEAGEAVWAFCDAALSPWRNGPCVLGRGENLIVRCRAAGEQIWKYPEVMGVPDMLYLHRALAGLYTMARTLEVEADWAGLMRQHLTAAVDRAAGR